MTCTVSRVYIYIYIYIYIYTHTHIYLHSINNIEYLYLRHLSIIIFESFLSRSVGKTIFEGEVLSEMLAIDFSRSVVFLFFIL